MVEDPEQIRFIGDEEAAMASRRVRGVKPNFRQLSEIDSKYVDSLELAASMKSADNALKDDKCLVALLMGLKTIKKDANAVQYISELILEGCKLDTSNWARIASFAEVDAAAASYECFKNNWQVPSTNDSVAYLLSSLLPYIENSGFDVRPIFKMIIDPNQERMSPAGRLGAISNLLRLGNVREDLCNSSTLRNVISQGLFAKDTEQVYFATLALWQLTFNKSVLQETKGILFVHRSMIRAFMLMFNTIKKEKIVRASVMVLNNIIDEEWLFEILIQQKIDHVLTSLSYEKWRDEELYNDIDSLLRRFYYKVNQMSNFERYLKELDSGKFLPGPLHTEKFWVQNVNRFENNEYEAIKKLSKLLFTAEDSTTLALVLFDLGEFSRLYPTGKQITANVGAKSKIMDLMNHPNKEIAREALLTTQKMMLDNWKQVSRDD